MEPTKEPLNLPSWLRWPPNCCETCEHWRRRDYYIGLCDSPISTHVSTVTDLRFRCQDFHRKPDNDTSPK